MTRDILEKRNVHKPEECAQCSEKESNRHLMLECLVGKEGQRQASGKGGHGLGLELFFLW